ncbi:MAG: gluconate 2-dehydrogenase subunit 3 family protein [Candidatus Solibacter sp.]
MIDRRLFLLSAIPIPFYAASPLQVLSPREAVIVEALCDQIVPADDAPGARQAGVLYYIDRQLAGPLARFAPRYHAALPVFNGLPDLPFAEQTAFLQALKGEPAAFFQLVIDHTMQSYYGSPEHGGNRDEASWKMLDIVDVMGGHKH